MRSQRTSMLCRSPLLIGVVFTTVLGTSASVHAQTLKEVQTPDAPLVLKAQGSFFVGGDAVEQTQRELGDLGPGGHITVNQTSASARKPASLIQTPSSRWPLSANFRSKVYPT